MSALYEQKTSQWVVWDSLRGEFNGTLMLRDFLEVSLNSKIPSSEIYSKFYNKLPNTAEEMKNSVSTTCPNEPVRISNSGKFT